MSKELERALDEYLASFGLEHDLDEYLASFDESSLDKYLASYESDLDDYLANIKVPDIEDLLKEADIALAERLSQHSKKAQGSHKERKRRNTRPNTENG